MKPTSIRYLAARDVAALAFKDHRKLAATETSLWTPGQGDIILEALVPRAADKTRGGDFNVLYGLIALPRLRASTSSAISRLYQTATLDIVC